MRVIVADAGVLRTPSARYRHADEGTLIAWARAEDETAFTVLVEAAQRRLLAVCHRNCQDPGDAADACQDALLAAWQNIASFRADSGFATWLCAIGVNACRAIHRRRRAYPQEIPVDAIAQADETSLIDLHDAVARALDELDQPVREAIVLREYGGLSYDEIAKALDVELNTVRTRIHRGRRKLAALLLEVTS
jgi:RNA polymerase sigma factor (sigma-70 family)